MATEAIPTIYWHDYETFGLNQRLDRPVQFAGWRTDMNFNLLTDQPDIWYCRPSMDYLPEPTSCLITGITPQKAEELGVSEHDFAANIREQMTRPGTISVGYNSMKFDDEVTRHLFWRNLYDPYEREWSEGCSRWDLFPFVLAVWALRPEGIDWPKNGGPDPLKAGLYSFRLEKLTRANGLEHSRAHDAASDVEATIALARLLAQRQPRLWQWALNNRSKASVRAALETGRPCVCVDPSAGQRRGFLRIVLPITVGPVNKNEYLVWDCREDPEELVGMSAEDIRRRAFGSKSMLGEGETRLPLSVIKINTSPFVCSDLRVLTPKVCERFGLDLEKIVANGAKLTALQKEVVSPVYMSRTREEGTQPPQPDTDAALYSDMIPNTDRPMMQHVQELAPEALTTGIAEGRIHFEDSRLNEVLWRLRGRSWPESLTEDELEKWRDFCAYRLSGAVMGVRSFDAFFEEIDKQAEVNDALIADGRLDDARYERRQAILDDLYAWGERLGAYTQGELDARGK